VVAGVGNIYLDELQQIADTGSNSIILADTINDLRVTDISAKVCPGKLLIQLLFSQSSLIDHSLNSIYI